MLATAMGYRLVRGFVRLLLWLFYRRVDVVGAERIPSRGPLIIVANHHNSLVDPMLIMGMCPRRITVLAKAPLFRHPLIGPFLRAVGALPVHRREEAGDDPRKNEALFATSIAHLRAGGAVLIFPEGRSQPVPTLLPLRTGAARLLLGAEADGGGHGVTLLPVGLVFQTPGTFRVASALVAVGPPIDVDDCVAAYGAEPEATVRRLTERLAWAIRAQIVEAEDQHTLELAGALERAWREERGGAPDAAASLAWRPQVRRAAPPPVHGVRRGALDRRQRREARGHAAAGALGHRLARAAVRADARRRRRHASHGRRRGHRQDGGRPRALPALLGARGLAGEARRRPPGARRLPAAAGTVGADRAGVARAAGTRRAAGAGLRPVRPRPPAARRSHRRAPRPRERGDDARRAGAHMSGRDSPRAILAVLTGLNGLNYLDRYVGAATLPLILGSLSLSDAAGGLLQSAFILTYAIVCPFIGWAGDRGARMRLAAAGVFLWSVATVASGLAPTYAMLLLARAVVGVGEASYAVVTPSLLSDCYPPERRARVLGIFYAAIPVGSALGYVVGGLVGEHLGWRAAFFVARPPGMVLAFVLLLPVEPRRGAHDAGGTGAVTPLSLGAALKALVARRPWVSHNVAQV